MRTQYVEKVVYWEGSILRKRYIEKAVFWENSILRGQYFEKAVRWEVQIEEEVFWESSMVRRQYFEKALRSESSYHVENALCWEQGRILRRQYGEKAVWWEVSILRKQFVEKAICMGMSRRQIFHSQPISRLARLQSCQHLPGGWINCCMNRLIPVDCSNTHRDPSLRPVVCQISGGVNSPWRLPYRTHKPW